MLFLFYDTLNHILVPHRHTFHTSTLFCVGTCPLIWVFMIQRNIFHILKHYEDLLRLSKVFVSSRMILGTISAPGCYSSPRVRSVEPDILISINGFPPGSFPHF